MPDLDSLARQVNLIQKDLDNLKRIVKDLTLGPSQSRPVHPRVTSQPQQNIHQRTMDSSQNPKQASPTPKPQVEVIKPQAPRPVQSVQNVQAPIHAPQQPQKVQQIAQSPTNPSSELPGVEGVFDGYAMILDNGTSLPVPPNYAAKSRIVYGDRLRMVEENGTSVFKQVQKVPRKMITGILDKTDSKWFLLTNEASYAISSNAAEYNKATPHCEAEAFIPEDRVDAPFATLERVLNPDGQVVPSSNMSQQSVPVASTQSIQPNTASTSTVPSSSIATISSPSIPTSPATPQQPQRPVDPKVLYEDDLR